MIGTKAFLVQILVVSFALVMGLWALRKSLNSIRGRWSVEAVLLGLFGVFISTMFLLPFILQVRAFSTLKSMKAAEIRSFAVGATVIENRIQIESLVGDLHSAEWFTGMHGGWSNERPARIERSAAPPHPVPCGALSG